MPFHYMLANTFTAGVYGVALQPSTNLGTRVLVEADAWAHFRVRSLAFRLHRQPTVTNIQAAGFVGGVQDTAPGSLAQVSELLPACFVAGSATQPSDWVRPTRSELAGPLPWYKTIPGSADSTEESPGTIIVVGTGTDAFLLEMRGIFEFKTSVSTGNTPSAVEMHRRLREEKISIARNAERELLLKILNMGVVAPTLLQNPTFKNS